MKKKSQGYRGVWRWNISPHAFEATGVQSHPWLAAQLGPDERLT